MTASLSGWVSGWMDGWVDGWMDGWMDGEETARCLGPLLSGIHLT